MNKSRLIKNVAKKCGVTISQADFIINTFMDSISDCVKSGEDVTLHRFGSFNVKERKERIGYNPLTGQKVIFSAKKYVKFTPREKLIFDKS